MTEALILAVAFTWNIRAAVDYGKPFSESHTIERMYCLCTSTLADLDILACRWRAPRIMSMCVAMSCTITSIMNVLGFWEVCAEAGTASECS